MAALDSTGLRLEDPYTCKANNLCTSVRVIVTVTGIDPGHRPSVNSYTTPRELLLVAKA